MKLSRPDPEKQSRRALLLSLISLAVPIVGAAFFPEWISEDIGLLLWILPLTPAFLLSYYHGWKGASLALAGGMAALSAGESLLVLAGTGAPPVEWMLLAVLVLLVVALGSGWLSELFRQALERAREEAVTDPGTGLPNRRAATEFLEKAFAAAKRGGVISVVLFDLDHFKAINDEHGHAEGDRVLRAFATVLAGTTRTMNISARYGGEEFISVLLQSDAAGAMIFAERVRAGLAGLGLPIPVTVSGGVAQYEAGMASPDVLVAAADQALYRAKSNGRNRIEALQPRGRVRPPSRPAERDSAARSAAGSGERILVVDDDDAARSSLSRALRRMGYSVLETGSARTAISIVQGLEEPLDLLVTDIMMPDIQGFRLVEMMEEEHPPLRVIYISGYDQEEVDWAGVPGAARRFISKPVMIDELSAAATELLRSPPDAGTAAPPSRTPVAAEPQADGGPVSPRPDFDVDRAELARARIVVVAGPGEAAWIRAALQGTGVENVEIVTAVPDEGVPDADLLVVDSKGERFSLDRAIGLGRDGDGRGPAVLALADEGGGARMRELLGRGLVQVVPRPVDGTLLVSAAWNLLRIRWLLRARADDAELFGSRLAAGAAELHESRMEILRRLAHAAEYRDDLTAEHAERVGRIAGVLAGELGWSVERRRLLEEAATLHDVGKLSVPDNLLKKTGRYTEEEREAMQSHTTKGAELLAGSRNPLLRLAREIALTHHERWDGDGYPRGLRGAAIPEAGRIVSVADTFDTMTSKRPYREPIEVSNVVHEIAAQAGGQFDPDVVAAFLAAHEKGLLELARSGDRVAWPDDAMRRGAAR